MYSWSCHCSHSWVYLRGVPPPGLALTQAPPVWAPGFWSPSTSAAPTTTEIPLFSHLLSSSHCNPRGSQIAEEHGKWGVEMPSTSSTETTGGQVFAAAEPSSVDSAAWWLALETT